ncbi:11482_t:CDS:2 [Ambispora gerdemannii]|uniref:11482_t:CDS:1 n=1 Tax=Ambispora gerdemannii TaxID=144530 RepID=A0A9N8Z5H6_9GLOM|nr:11482_t:CDS:2 [Ambispora gerdemannii]
MPLRYAKLHNQNYKQLFLHYARKGENFQDEHFPLTDSSIWKKERPLHETIEWKRCKDLCRNPHLFIFKNGQLSPEVVQGAVGNCWLVSALGVLAAHPHLLERVVPRWGLQDWVHSEEPGKKTGVYHLRDTERHPGIFRFRFYRFGQWIEVVVDDYLPTVNGHLIYAHSKNPNEMWCALLEKAYAKLCGCYEALDSGSASDALVDLTGTVPETIELGQNDNDGGGMIQEMGQDAFVYYILKAAKKGALMSCSINALDEERLEERLLNGLIIGHSYGITQIQKLRHNWRGKKEVLLLRLHNPWGEVEWNGPWSDSSPEWAEVSEAKRKKMGLIVEDDGDFWMAFEDFVENFSTLVICRNLNTPWYAFGPHWHNVLFHGVWSVETGTAGGCINNQETFFQNPQFAFTVTKPTVIIIALMQEDHRTIRLNNNLTIGFVCLKVEENRKYRIHRPTYMVTSQVTYINAREVTSKVELDLGRYIVIPSTFNAGEGGSYFLRMFSSRYIDVTPLMKDAPTKKWYHSLMYWGNAYFVGMARIQIMKVHLKRELSGFIKITFSDLRDRLHEHYVSRSFKKAIVADIGNEYVFYIRDPLTSGITLQLYESHTFSKAKLVGEMRVGFKSYCRENKEGKIWEITKTFTKMVQVPRSLNVMTTQEVETTEITPNVAKNRESLLSASNNSIMRDDETSSSVSHHMADTPNRMVPTPRRFAPKSNTNTMLVPRSIDAGIGEIQIRISYFKGVNA